MRKVRLKRFRNEGSLWERLTGEDVTFGIEENQKRVFKAAEGQHGCENIVSKETTKKETGKNK